MLKWMGQYTALQGSTLSNHHMTPLISRLARVCIVVSQKDFGCYCLTSSMRVRTEDCVLSCKVILFDHQCWRPHENYFFDGLFPYSLIWQIEFLTSRTVSSEYAMIGS